MLMSDFDQKVLSFFKNYQDRGMKKWAGFFLSDHTLKINKDRKKQMMIYSKRPAMTETQLSQELFTAFRNHYYVQVQLKQVDIDGKIPADICGWVEGYCQDKIIISGKEVVLSQINNIELKK